MVPSVRSLSSVKFVDGKLELSDEDFKSLDGMLRGISAYYHGWYGETFDTIYERCWEVAMGCINGGSYGLNMICRSCYNMVSDVIRANKRGMVRGFSCDLNDISVYLQGKEVDQNLEIDETACKVPKIDTEFNHQYRTGDVFMDKETVREIIGLFEKGSREWQYLMLVAIRVGSIEVDRQTFDRLFPCKHSLDYEVAHLLGYNSQSNNGYRGIKNRVRNRVSHYLGF